jgi:hypothetical protein
VQQAVQLAALLVALLVALLAALRSSWLFFESPLNSSCGELTRLQSIHSRFCAR